MSRAGVHNFDSMSLDSLITVLVNHALLNLLSLNVIQQFAIQVLAETLNQTTTIVLKCGIGSSQAGGQSSVTLTQDHTGTDHTADRHSAQSNSGTVQLDKLPASLSIDDSQILISVLLSISSAVSSHLLVFNRLVDLVDSILGLVNNFVNLQGGLTSQDDAANSADDTESDQNLRTALLQLNTCRIERAVCF